jgi:hypothetical protein
MTQDHERRAEAAEREVAELEERSERVGEQIDEARKDWEAKVADPSVPGAGGDPDRAEEGGRHPETAYPAKGPEDEVATEDPTENDDGVDTTPKGEAGEGDGGAAEGGDESERRGDDDKPPPDPTETD